MDTGRNSAGGISVAGSGVCRRHAHQGERKPEEACEEIHTEGGEEISGAIAGGTVGLASGLGSGASIGTVAGGLLGGAFRGASGGMKSGFSGISKGVATQRKNNIEARTRNAEGGGGFWGVSTTGSKIAHMLGQQDDFEKAKSKYEANEKRHKPH